MIGECIRCKHGEFDAYGEYVCFGEGSENYCKRISYSDSCEYYDDMEIEENTSVKEALA